jgi:polyhydroxybutyrate depolymerase
VVVLHGAGSEGPRYLELNGWGELARREGVVVVAPDALPHDPAKPPRFRDNPRIWNSGRPKDGEVRSQEDEGAFIEAVLRELAGRGVRIDATRRYLVGHSNGGALTWKMLAEHPERWTAGVSVAGGLVHLPDSKGHAPPLMHIMGDSDPLVPIAGGATTLPWGMVREIPPVFETLGHWAVSVGLPFAPVRVEEREGSTRYLWEEHDPPRFSATIVRGQGHEWPGGGYSGLPESMIGPAAKHFDATAAAWAFLSGQRLPRPVP